MKITVVVGNALMFKYLAFKVQNEFGKDKVQVIVEDTYSWGNIKKQIKFRIKKYGVLKFIDEVMYRLFETIIQRNVKIYRNSFKDVDLSLLKIDYICKNINDYDTEEVIKNFKPDVMVIYGTSIVKEKIFTIPQYGTLNVHPGINPKYRGAGNFWALKNKDFKNYGFTIHLVDKGIDTGKIISSKRIKYNPSHKILPYMYVDITKEAIKELINILKFFKKNGKLPEGKPLTNEEGYYTWLGLSDYIKMRWKLRNV